MHVIMSSCSIDAKCVRSVSICILVKQVTGFLSSHARQSVLLVYCGKMRARDVGVDPSQLYRTDLITHAPLQPFFINIELNVQARERCVDVYLTYRGKLRAVY